MPSLSSFFNKRDENVVAITKRFIRQLELNVSDTSIEDTLLTHPEYPSLFSISDSLSRWKINNAALQIEPEALTELQVPFITCLRKKHELSFAIVSKVSEKDVEVVFDNERKRYSKEDFLESWNGNVLLAEKTEDSGETGYTEKRKLEVLESLRTPMFLIGSGILFLYNILTWNLYDWRTLSLASIYIVGLVIALLLMSLQYGTGNLNICKIGERSDCMVILNSPVSKIAGISLSEIGVLYFLFSFIILSFGSGNSEPIYYGLLGFLSLLSLPFTFFSIYYQWNKAKTWCILCLAVVILLWLNFMVSYEYLFLFNPTIDLLIGAIVILFSLGLILFSISPLLKKSNEHKYWKLQYRKLKNDKDLFLYHLKRQTSIPAFRNGFAPIILGNPFAEHTITFVTNPFCSPCAKTHKKLEERMSVNSNFKINLIFFACTAEAKQVSNYFLSLFQHGYDIGPVINFWYGDNGRNLNSLKKNFPLPGNTKLNNISEQHCEWCLNSGIPYTPFLYIDNYAMPKLYDIEEVILQLENLTLHDMDIAVI